MSYGGIRTTETFLAPPSKEKSIVPMFSVLTIKQGKGFHLFRAEHVPEALTKACLKYSNLFKLILRLSSEIAKLFGFEKGMNIST